MTMQPIEKQVHDAFELVKLEELWEQELRCQTPVEHGCTEHVTARAVWCLDPLLLCANAEENTRAAIERDRNACGECKKRVSDCWRVEAI